MVEQERHDQMIGGTTMAEPKDLDATHSEYEVKEPLSSSAVIFDKHGRPLVPQPMDDDNDPLNWSIYSKVSIIIVLAMWTFLGTFNMIIAGPIFFAVTSEFQMNFALTTYLVGGPLLSYGVASLFWVATGNRYGVRLCFVLASIAAGAFSIWGAEASSFGQLVAARTLASVAFAAPETLGPQVIGDVFFLKDRAKAMSFVVAFQGSGFAMGPLVGSFVTQNLGWRWTQWLMVILSFSVAVLLFIFHPETQYTADPTFAVKKRRLVQSFTFTRVSGGGRAKVHNFPVALAYPFRYLRHPTILILTTSFSLYLMVTNYLLTTQSISYAIVYNFDVGAGGLTFFAPLLGTWAGMLYSGITQDYFLNRKAIREDFVPEQRIPFLVLGCVLGTAGTILFGTCTQAKCHWITPLIGSFGNMFGFICLNSFICAYTVDVYLARADAALVIINGFKNLAAFGISYAIIVWNDASGYAIPFGVLSVIVFLAHVFAGILWWKGDKIRRWTANKFEDGKETYHGEVF